MEITGDLEDYVVIFENLLPEKANESLYKVCQSKYFDFQDAYIHNGTENVLDKNVRNVKTWSLVNYGAPNFTTTHWANMFIAALNKSFKDYGRLIKSDFIVKLQEINVLHYKPGGFYIKHIDHCTSLPRTLSAIYIINDNYDGGDLQFFKPNTEKIFKPLLKKNSLIVWPSNFLYPHTITPITSGERYSIVSWGL